MWRLSALLALSSVLVACSDAGGDADASSGGSGTQAGVGGESSQSGPGTGGAGSSAAGAGGSAGGADQGGGGIGGEWGSEQCPAPANAGVEVGQQLPEILVKDCDGLDVSLSELCGASALWIFAAHGWCPLCQSVSSQAEAIHDSFSAEGIASVTIVVADGQGEPPTADYCKIWRDQHGHDDVATLYDPTGDILALWSGSSSLSAFVSSDRVIVSKLSHDSNVDHIEQGIEGALAY